MFVHVRERAKWPGKRVWLTVYVFAHLRARMCAKKQNVNANCDRGARPCCAVHASMQACNTSLPRAGAAAQSGA
eukprot:2053418-Pleurochrysis_carterae.AAC.1